MFQIITTILVWAMLGAGPTYAAIKIWTAREQSSEIEKAGRLAALRSMARNQASNQPRVWEIS